MFPAVSPNSHEHSWLMPCAGLCSPPPPCEKSNVHSQWQHVWEVLRRSTPNLPSIHQTLFQAHLTFFLPTGSRALTLFQGNNIFLLENEINKYQTHIRKKESVGKKWRSTFHELCAQRKYVRLHFRKKGTLKYRITCKCASLLIVLVNLHIKHLAINNTASVVWTLAHNKQNVSQPQLGLKPLRDSRNSCDGPLKDVKEIL